MTEFRRNSRLEAAAVGLLAAVGLAGAVPFLSIDRLVSVLHDDAFYFFQVARNLASGRGFTFDGLHATNGFQPLWLFVISPVFWVARGDEVPLRIIAIVELVLLALAVGRTFFFLRHRVGFSPALLAALLIAALPGAGGSLRGGMESALALWLVVECWLGWTAFSEADSEKERSRNVHRLGFCLGACPSNPHFGARRTGVVVVSIPHG